MSKMAQYNNADAKNKYSTKILEALKPLACKGKLQSFLQNGFTYISISDAFSRIPTEIMHPFGFREVTLMNKPNTPRTHISVMNYAEQRRVSRRRPHTVQETGEKKWNCCLKTTSNHIEAIRVDLGLEHESESFNINLTVCEKLRN